MGLLRSKPIKLNEWPSIFKINGSEDTIQRRRAHTKSVGDVRFGAIFSVKFLKQSWPKKSVYFFKYFGFWTI